MSDTGNPGTSADDVRLSARPGFFVWQLAVAYLGLRLIKDALNRQRTRRKERRLGRSRHDQTVGSGFRGNLPNRHWPNGF